MTARLAVLGNPIEHSRSPRIHELFGESCGVALTYEKLLVPDGKFDEVASAFLADGVGINVTVPCKADAWEFVDKASVIADKAMAVNTIARNQGGGWHGYSTDGEGLIRDLKDNLGWELSGQKVLVVGAGGAVSSVLADLIGEAPDEIHLYNRTKSKADNLAERFGSDITVVEPDDMSEGYDLIVNGTSASLSGQPLSIPGRIVSTNSHCYDMVYSAETTSFNRWCQEQSSCTVSDGLGMLVEQAAAAFEIWFGMRPETSQVLKELRAAL